MDGWMEGWMGGKAGLRIAYSNQKKERELDAEREVLVANRDGFVAVEQAHINRLTERKSDTETIIKILRNMFKNKLGPDGKELK